MDLEFLLKQLMIERLMQRIDGAALSRWVDDIVERRLAPQDVADRLLDEFQAVGVILCAVCDPVLDRRDSGRRADSQRHSYRYNDLASNEKGETAAMEGDSMYGELVVLSGTAHPQLSQEIADYLGISLAGIDIRDFPNENIFVKLHHSVRGQDVFLIQPTTSPVNRNIMELLIIIDTLKRASAGRITAVIPYYAYGRTDKKDQPRVPITARLIADMITVAGAHRVLTLDLHAGPDSGFLQYSGGRSHSPPPAERYMQKKTVPDTVVVAADTGATKRARNFAQELHAPLAIIEKRRAGTQAEAVNGHRQREVQERGRVRRRDRHSGLHCRRR